MYRAQNRPMIVLILSAATAVSVSAEEVRLGKHTFQLPDGFSIQLIAGPPMVDRPICADFDEHGRLYVADSSGSNEPVEEQLQNPSHRIVRLEDTDGDGEFDKSTIFADRVMFPEGTLWHDGSLYVAAPPSIWKLTDTDNDGLADKREEWWQGQTLTHCANDLHGPYLGPDGWFYWCKGAFAEQTYEREGQPPLVTRAAHIFRCRPDAPRDPNTGSVLSSAIEPVMTGGMANPVDVAFTPGGERVFSTTFLIRPQNGLRDGLIHAIYGGVYGMNNAARIAGHKRTGELMPPLLHMGAAAPCGLTRYESNAFGDDYRDNLFTCLFNMRKVTRHELQPNGATFNAAMEDFLVSDHLDFHPTDVIEDADGSLIVIDTGGWYKLCCPTSQLEKPDILGAIYRVRRKDAVQTDDPRGLAIDWTHLKPGELADLLGDSRPAVRKRAIEELADRGAEAVDSLSEVLNSSKQAKPARLGAIWALTRIDHNRARASVRTAFHDPDPIVQQAAAHSAGLLRDPDAWADLVALLKSESASVRRSAAEALGRIGNKEAVPALLLAASKAIDRTEEHSLIYALIEIGDPGGVRLQLSSEDTRTWRAALIALDQMNGGDLSVDEVAPLLWGDDATLSETANWIVDHHRPWSAALVPHFRDQIRRFESLSAEDRLTLKARLTQFAPTGPIRNLFARSLADDRVSIEARHLVLAVMAQSNLNELPSSWVAPLASLLLQGDSSLAEKVIAVLRRIPVPESGANQIVDALVQIAAEPDSPDNVRLGSLWAVRERVRDKNANQFRFVTQWVDGAIPVNTRATAVEILAAANLDSDQLYQMTMLFEKVSPLDINRLLAAYGQSRNERVGLALVESLKRSPARSAVDMDALNRQLKDYPNSVKRSASELSRLLETETAEQTTRLQAVLTSLPDGDVRRGQEVFHSAQAACSACHAIGYLGGEVGPDLTRIARVRSRRDLLESVIFPSASIVQNYESVTVITVDGRVHTGLVQTDTDEELVLAIGPDKELRIDQDDVDEVSRSNDSIMPTGLDQQLTPQQLADLLEFLATRK